MVVRLAKHGRTRVNGAKLCRRIENIYVDYVLGIGG